MKRFIFILLIIMHISLSAETKLNFETNLSENEFNTLSESLSYVIKKDVTKRHFIPGNKKKIITEEITMDNNNFNYYLKIVQLSRAFDNNEFTPFYYEIKMEGEITSLIKDSEDNYRVTIYGMKKTTNEYYNYYGPRNTKSVSRQSTSGEYRFTFNLETIKDLNEDNSLYFIGITRPFFRDELKELTLDELGYLRNEFYARKGFIFRTDKMKSYFTKKPWFKPVTRDVKLTEIELENVYLIRAMEQEINFGSNSAEVDQINKLYEIAQLRLLTKEDIKDISPHKLPYLRNTFFAKKGFIFNVLRYRDYFENQNWYVGTKESVDGLLSENDKKNINFIKTHEDNR